MKTKDTEMLFTYLPPSEIEWSFSSYDYSGYNIPNGAGSLSQIFGFKAKNYNFFLGGDGGVGSYNGGILQPHNIRSFR